MVNLMNFDAETVTLFRETGWLDKIGSITLTSNNDCLKGEELISLTATVKNLEDTAMSNVLVKFILGSNVVGYATTNQSGVATFYHRINKQGVYDFHAVVGKIGASTRVYVSSIGNLLSYEVMSGGDYGAPSQSNGDFIKGNGITVGTSMDWSTTGEKSIKIIKSGTSGPNLRFPITGGAVPGETLKIKFDCHIQGVAARVGIIQYNSNDALITTDVVSVSEGEFEMSKVLDNTVASVAIYVLMNNSSLNDIIYMDNISAILGDE